MGRIVVVSNRVSTATGADSNTGGLAIAVHTALSRESALWFGWTGETVDHAPGPPRIIREDRLTRVLVDLNRDDYQGYYAGFANRALWPLLHDRIDLVEFDHGHYAAYRRVSDMFARHLHALLEPDDIIWVHDYHLIPLAQALRSRGAGQRIGFFLHTPFPPPEVLTTLPVHDDLMRALCSYDLIGFQTETDLHAFHEYITREAQGRVQPDGLVIAYDRATHAGAFPISIDPDAVLARAERGSASGQCRRLRDSLAGRDLIIGVDRLDYTKGLLKRFEAVERLLEQNASRRRRIVVLQIAPPSRGDVPEYRKLRSALDARIGRINGRFGEPDLLPVRYLNRHFGQDTLFGFYRASMVALVTPLRDGMNLVAKEYVASQDPEDPGVLVLSRFAGAARELDAALIVNPYDSFAVAAALEQALSLPRDERRTRHAALMRAIRRNSIKGWRDSYLAAIDEVEPARPRQTRRPSRPGAYSTL